jgi:hypothetical protein
MTSLSHEMRLICTKPNLVPQPLLPRCSQENNVTLNSKMLPKKRKRENNIDSNSVSSTYNNVQIEDSQEEKKKRRLVRNREAAQASRERKKQYIQQLERDIEELKVKIDLLEQENKTLRTLLIDMPNSKQNDLKLIVCNKQTINYPIRVPAIKPQLNHPTNLNCK